MSNKSKKETLHIKLIRFDKKEDYTIGGLYLEDIFTCWTLEDEEREVKVMHETCIPEGTYEVEFMETITPLTKKYREKYDWFNKHLHVKDVPGFTGIYLHIGNTDDDTSGCILVGAVAEPGRILRSTETFKKVYEIISEVLNNDIKVILTIKSVS